MLVKQLLAAQHHEQELAGKTFGEARFAVAVVWSIVLLFNILLPLIVSFIMGWFSTDAGDATIGFFNLLGTRRIERKIMFLVMLAPVAGLVWLLTSSKKYREWVGEYQRLDAPTQRKLLRLSGFIRNVGLLWPIGLFLIVILLHHD